MLAILLSVISIFVHPATNESDEAIFSNALVSRTTQILLEEYVQDIPNVRLVSDPAEADVHVYPKFISYERFDSGLSFAIFKARNEKVALTMEIAFIDHKNDFTQNLTHRSLITKSVRSNFYSMVESEEDFANSLLLNLIKKTVDESFAEADTLIF